MWVECKVIRTSLKILTVGGRELDFHTADSPEARLHRRRGMHFPVHLTGCSDPGYLKINSDPR